VLERLAERWVVEDHRDEGLDGPGLCATPKAWQTATRPCSIETLASAGNPTTPPAAEIVATAVRKCSSSTT
jgi:hypothetical protein